MCSERIADLEQQIAELKRRWPAHSVPPIMVEQLDELEAELKEELNRATEYMGTLTGLAQVRCRRRQSPRSEEGICLASGGPPR